MAVKTKGKKGWAKVVALKPFNEQFIGEAFVANEQDAIGRKINISLMNLTNDPKRQNININFEITKKHADGFGAEITGYSLVSSSIKRFIRRNCNRIDGSYLFKTADNKKVRIKPLILTRSLAKGSVLRAIRKAAREFLSDAIGKSTYEKFINDVLHYNVQKNLKSHIKKIYPLRICEIKVIKVEKERKSKGLEEKAPEKKKKIKKEEKREEKKAEPKKEKEEEPKKEDTKDSRGEKNAKTNN